MSVGADEAMKYVLSGRTTDDDHPNQWQLQAVLQKKKKKQKWFRETQIRKLAILLGRIFCFFDSGNRVYILHWAPLLLAVHITPIRGFIRCFGMKTRDTGGS